MVDVGTLAPDAVFTTPDGKPSKSSDYRGKKLVLYFYPKDDTSGCTKEAQEFSAQMAAFDAAGVQVLGVSKDPPKKHVKFIEKYALTVPLASDAETDGLAEAMGVWIEKSMYGKKYMGIERCTFLIGKDGEVLKRYAPTDTPASMAKDIEAALAA